MSKTLNSTVTLSSGHEMPIFGLGTWLGKPGEVGPAVATALRNGYKHIDCAWSYLNQTEIGDELEKLFSSGQLKREDIFITSKVWNTFHKYELAKANIDDTLSQLKIDYIDLMLMHWPMAFQPGPDPVPTDAEGNTITTEDDFMDAWRGMEEAVKEGKIKSIGLANFNHKQIQRVIDEGTIKPAVLQVETHPYLQQKKLWAFCKEQNIAFTSYSPLGNPGPSIFRNSDHPNILVDETLRKIADKHQKTPAQVALRWAVQNDILLIPKSTNEGRLKENANIFDFELSAEDLDVISSLDRNFRLVARLGQKNAKFYPFDEEF